MNRDYRKLQNGSDIRGIVLTGVEGENPNLGQEEAEQLASGFLLWLSKKTGKSPKDLTISVGFDPRLSGKYLMHGILNGTVPYGTKILDCGLASTPAMFMSTVFSQFNCDGAVMITASHLPFNRNGFKYFDKSGGLDKKDITEIIRYAQSEEELSALGDRKAEDNFTMILGKKVYNSIYTDLMSVYCDSLKEKIKKDVNCREDYNKPLEGLKIVVDAGNGGGGFYAERVLKPLGADVSASCFLEPDGTFPNHAPNPEDRAAMESVCMQVLSNSADFGLIFDTDVDRASAVDRKGREIGRNAIVAMAAALTAEEYPGTTVVTDSITSDYLTVFLEEKLGLKHRRFKRGYKNVINEAIRLNEEGIDCQLAIETSGHAALKENRFLDDGAYLATKIVIKAAKLAQRGQTLDTLISELKEPKEALEVRLPIRCENFGEYGEKILEDLRAWASMKPCARRSEGGEIVAVEEGGCCLCHCGMSVAEPNFEGVRVNFSEEQENGWCLLRKSLHDPIMPLNIESDVEGGCEKIAEKLRPFLSAYTELDISKL